LPVSENAVGIDLGVTSLIATSNGEKLANPKHFKKHRKRLKKAQKNLSRKQKGSKNREKGFYRTCLAKLTSKMPS
jgi:putative transposase